MAKTAIAEARAVARRRFGDDYVPAKARAFRSRSQGGGTPRFAQEAHEAIRPTGFARAPEEVERRLDRAAAALYGLIWKRALASQMAEARLDRVRVELAPEAVAGGPVLAATGSAMAFDGHLRVWREDGDGDERNGVRRGSASGARNGRRRVGPWRCGSSARSPNPRPATPRRGWCGDSMISASAGRRPGGRSWPCCRNAVMPCCTTGASCRPSGAGSSPPSWRRSSGNGWIPASPRRWRPISTASRRGRSPGGACWRISGAPSMAPSRMPARSSGRRCWRRFEGRLEGFLFGAGPADRRCPACRAGELELKLSRYGPFVGCAAWPACGYRRRLAAAAVAGDGYTGPRELGTDPHTGQAVTLRRGPNGRYVQRGAGQGREGGGARGLREARADVAAAGGRARFGRSRSRAAPAGAAPRSGDPPGIRETDPRRHRPLRPLAPA